MTRCKRRKATRVESEEPLAIQNGEPALLVGRDDRLTPRHDHSMIIRNLPDGNDGPLLLSGRGSIIKSDAAAPQVSDERRSRRVLHGVEACLARSDHVPHDVVAEKD